jgi:hypothetical protein
MVQTKHNGDDWIAYIPNAHGGYISWEQFKRNLELRASNGRTFELARRSPPREGAALLQGRTVAADVGGISASDIAQRGASKKRSMSAIVGTLSPVSGTDNLSQA